MRDTWYTRNTRNTGVSSFPGVFLVSPVFLVSRIPPVESNN